MKLEQYVSALLPSLERDRILEDITITLDELREHTLPAYEAVLSENVFASTYRFKSPWVQSRQKEFERSVRTNRLRGNMIEVTTAVLREQVARLEWIRGMIEKQFSSDVTRAGLTYPRAALLQLLEAITFVVKYSRRFLLCVYGFEIPSLFKSVSTGFPYSKADLKMIEDQFDGYCRLLGILARGNRELQQDIDAIPDIVVDVNAAQQTNSVVGVGKLDPLAMGVIPYAWNPIYHLRLAVAEWQVSRYEAAKNEKQALELRLIQLKMARDGNVDAAIEKNIERTEKRVQDLGYKLAQMEQKYAK